MSRLLTAQEFGLLVGESANYVLEQVTRCRLPATKIPAGKTCRVWIDRGEADRFRQWVQTHKRGRRGNA